MRITVLLIALILISLQAADTLPGDSMSLQLVTDSNQAFEESAPVDLSKTIPPSGREFLAVGYGLIGAGVLSLICAAGFNAAYNNRPAMGDSPDTSSVPKQKNPKLKRYATICLWTALGCGVSSSPFLYIGYKKQRQNTQFLNRHLNSYRDETFTLEVSFAF